MESLHSKSNFRERLRLGIATILNAIGGILFVLRGVSDFEYEFVNISIVVISFLISLLISSWLWLTELFRQRRYFAAIGRMFVVVLFVVPLSTASGCFVAWSIGFVLLCVWGLDPPFYVITLAFPLPFIVAGFVAAFIAADARPSEPSRRM